MVLSRLLYPIEGLGLDWDGGQGRLLARTLILLIIFAFVITTEKISIDVNEPLRVLSEVVIDVGLLEEVELFVKQLLVQLTVGPKKKKIK